MDLTKITCDDTYWIKTAVCEANPEKWYLRMLPVYKWGTKGESYVKVITSKKFKKLLAAT